MKCLKVTTRRILCSSSVLKSQSFARTYSETNSTTPNLKTLNDIPGLSTLPIIGPLHHFLPVVGSIGPSNNFFDMLKVFHQRFGPIVKLDGIFARSAMVILYEPEHYQQVFKAQEENPLRPGFDTMVYYRSVLRKTTFDGVYGLTTAQGQQWRDFRSKVNPALLKIKLVKLYAPGLDEIAKEMVARIKTLKNSEYLKTNMDSELSKLSLESIGLVGLGTRLGCLRSDLTSDHPAAQLMGCVKDIINLTYSLEFLPNPWKYFATPSFKKLMRVLDLQWKISTKYIEEAKWNIKARGREVADEEKSIIEKLLAIDERVAVMMANEMLLAGIDTVSFVNLNVMYHLATNPDKQKKLREEIRSGDTGKRYLKACIKEALRLWPVVPANLRRTSKEYVIDGYVIPEGVDVIAPNEYLSKHEKYYPRPLEYIPERWLTDQSDPIYYGHAHPMVTLPFGYGVRTCIGRRIAELEIELFITRLIDELEVSWHGPPVKVTTKVVNEFLKPYCFRFDVSA